MQISFTPEFAERLRPQIGDRTTKAHNPHGGGNTYELERALDEDMLLTSVGWANSYYQAFEPGARYTDEWGVGWRVQEYGTRFGKGIYTEVASHPLAEDGAIDSYVAPDPNRDALYREAAWAIREFKDEYWMVGATVTTIFETAWALRGLERLLIDLIDHPELADRILDIPYQYHLSAARRLVEMGVDMIWTGDDMGGQQGMILSPELWRRFLKPRMATFIRTIKGINPDLKVAYHSDGGIYPIIEELIEIGVDVLNPIQPACMDPAQVKADFGDRLCFWGTIDEQHTLPFGSPDDVRQEVAQRLRTIGRGGGLIIGPTHHVQLDTPLENFWAMVETIRGTPYSTIG
jgi:uroporphyrinogen decarboxylase